MLPTGGFFSLLGIFWYPHISLLSLTLTLALAPVCVPLLCVLTSYVGSDDIILSPKDRPWFEFLSISSKPGLDGLV